MQRDELVRETQPEALVRRLSEQAPALLEPGHSHGPAMESIREATYRGHHIVIRTSYQLEVDGQPIQGHLGVSNDGQVHYHAVPELGFASAVDLVKQLIDTFPEDFEGTGSPVEPDHDHGQGS
jgi:hypothetical protein